MQCDAQQEAAADTPVGGVPRPCRDLALRAAARYHVDAATITETFIFQQKLIDAKSILLNGIGIQEGTSCGATEVGACRYAKVKGVAAHCDGTPKTRLKLLHIGAATELNVTVDGHRMIIVAADGVSTEPTEVGAGASRLPRPPLAVACFAHAQSRAGCTRLLPTGRQPPPHPRPALRRARLQPRADAQHRAGVDPSEHRRRRGRRAVRQGGALLHRGAAQHPAHEHAQVRAAADVLSVRRRRG